MCHKVHKKSEKQKNTFTTKHTQKLKKTITGTAFFTKL